MKKLICILCILISVPVAAQTGTSADQLFYEAQALLTHYRDGEAMAKYEKVVAVNPNHYQSLYQLALLKSRIAGRSPDEAKKINYYHEAKDYAMRAYELNPNSAESNYIMALGIGGMALVSPARQSIACAYEMKSYLDKALELEPNHAPSWHLLGRWHYKIANLGLADVAKANLFFGGIPKGASNEMAISCLKKAVSINPKELIYQYDLARAYENVSQTPDCVETLQTALNLTVTTSEEQEIQRRCRQMLKKYEERY